MLFVLSTTCIVRYFKNVTLKTLVETRLKEGTESPEADPGYHPRVCPKQTGVEILTFIMATCCSKPKVQLRLTIMLLVSQVWDTLTC